MATKKITVRVDDLDGSEGAKPYRLVDPKTGKAHTIDLTAEHADALTAALKPYLDAVRKPVKGRARSDGFVSLRPLYDLDELIAWAKKRGIEVSKIGRTPRQVELDFLKAKGIKVP